MYIPTNDLGFKLTPRNIYGITLSIEQGCVDISEFRKRDISRQNKIIYLFIIMPFDVCRRLYSEAYQLLDKQNVLLDTSLTY